MILSVRVLYLIAVFLLTVGPCTAQPEPDAERLLADLKYLSSDRLEGRRTGSEGSRLARAYIREGLEARGVQPFEGGYEQPFSFTHPRDEQTYAGVNLVGYVEGTRYPDRYIVLTAHYDHLGVQDGAIYNGADDNASGVAGLLAAAGYFSRQRPEHSILFAVLDAEEMGLRGAHALLENLPVPREQVLLNVNLDMVSRSAKGELYAAGTHHYPALKPPLEEVAAGSPVHLRFGHDQPGPRPSDDWTSASDHAVFHQAGIPFIYFGVEDHPDYHRPTDDFENVDPEFFTRAVETILAAVVRLDATLEETRKAASR